MNRPWWLVVAACWTGSPPAPAPPPPPPPAPSVLARIESFTPPPIPPDAEGAEAIADTYDMRIDDPSTVPPTLTDALLCDLLQRLPLDLGRTVPASAVTEADMTDAIQIYLERPQTQIAGFRARAHWYFIRSLTGRERTKLAVESAARIHAREPVCPE